jgi:hypothetical protein
MHSAYIVCFHHHQPVWSELATATSTTRHDQEGCQKSARRSEISGNYAADLDRFGDGAILDSCKRPVNRACA